MSQLGLQTLCYVVLVFLASFFAIHSESACQAGCSLALLSYFVAPNLNLSYISGLFNQTNADILAYNPSISNENSIQANKRIDISFRCDCINNDFLGHTFSYPVEPKDTYDNVANVVFANLTTTEMLARTNSYPSTRIPDNATLNVTVNCSCGKLSVSNAYGLFLTYPLQSGETLASVASDIGFTSDVSILQNYNPGVNFSAGTGIVFLPVKGISKGAIAGICVSVVILLCLASYFYIRVYRRKVIKPPVAQATLAEHAMLQGGKSFINCYSTPGKTTPVLTPRAGGSSPFTGITVDKSVEFSYEELAKATNDFNISQKIGEGGFGAVYYAELRGEKAAIKKMDMQASREFLAELKVLTHAHHLNLVRLIGYCTEGSLFLVYEFIENGNLSEHLRGSDRDPLPWPTRVQIALDSARGLEYIHEHTVPVYIHRDIKSANILIDKNFHGKVADFGLTKLTEVGSTSLPTRLVGTFGYMPPEYAQYGDVSPKVDVYAFGVVLYELISAKEAIVKAYNSATESKGLVALFEDALSKPEPREDLQSLVDARLGENYPIDSVLKMAQLARACTQENPQLRPSMRSIVVALMTLSSSTEDWDMGSFYENQTIVNLMSGR
ncbi:hypothetical protein J5N97_016576 [Dioscorea zingiberensis]|uniref:non-specific serine/threonine protein kinase n=1 Tax=Dioscorea zingiberensis TaxID=325984 RepID=A0A9D5HFB1_9LILI|nr:hypothetical protein J5N97_016576 [Dioscorea zingiberensis]